jgi:hypothetical protein
MAPSAREEPSHYQGEGFEIAQKGETNSGPREWESAVECLVGVGARVLGLVIGAMRARVSRYSRDIEKRLCEDLNTETGTDESGGREKEFPV